MKENPKPINPPRNRPCATGLLFNLHVWISLLCSALFYYFYSQTFAKTFLFSSTVFNLYLRMLYFSFNLNKKLYLISIVRVILSAALLYWGFVWLKIGALSLLAAVLVYLLVLLVWGFYSQRKSYYGTF